MAVPCLVCGETLTWMPDFEGPGRGVWLDDVWDEAVCLSGTPLIRMIASSRLFRVTGWDQAMESLMWDMFIPRHVPDMGETRLSGQVVVVGGRSFSMP